MQRGMPLNTRAGFLLHLLLTLLALTPLSQRAHAAQSTVHLKGGRKIEGVIVHQDNEAVKVRMKYGTVTFQRKEIERIETEDTADDAGPDVRSADLRDEITLIASGGIRTAHDIAKAIALGADGVVLGTAEMVALECVKCGNCESGRGCPRGIATTDPDLGRMIDAQWGARRIANLYEAYRSQLISLLQSLNLRSISELRGRKDLLYDHPIDGQ